MSQKEVQALIWGALKWVVLVGLSLAFGLGAWASTLRADVNRALTAVEEMRAIHQQLDSLRIEQRHTTEEIQILINTRGK